MGTRFEIDAGAYLLAGLLLLSVPIQWVAAAIVVAVFHEVCHIAAIRLTGGSIYHIRIGACGAVIESRIDGQWEEFLCALAGPAGSLLLITLCRIWPRIAICGLLQGLYNLLPLFPLDGGRALHCIAGKLFPNHGVKFLEMTEKVTLILLAGIAIAASCLLSLGVLPIFVAVILMIRLRIRKRPCKQRQIRVQ